MRETTTSILFATNRQKKVIHDDGTLTFTGSVSPTITYGKCLVVPQPRIVPKRLQCTPIENGADEYFVPTLANATLSTTTTKTELIVFVHGFNQSFEEAIKCTYKFQQSCPADFQNTFDFAVFSWPARGDTGFPSIAKHGPIATLLTDVKVIGRYFDYSVDGASCEASEQPFINFLLDLVQNRGWKRLHLIGHSLGCQLLVRTLTNSLVLSALEADQAGVSPILQSVTFAAPDVDHRLFVNLKRTVLEVRLKKSRFLMFVSAADYALTVSRLLFQAPRAGLVIRPLERGLNPIDRQLAGRFFEKAFKFDGDEAAGKPEELGRGIIVDSSGAKQERLGYDDDQIYIDTLHFDFLFVAACRDVLRAVIQGAGPDPAFASSEGVHIFRNTA